MCAVLRLETGKLVRTRLQVSYIKGLKRSSGVAREV